MPGTAMSKEHRAALVRGRRLAADVSVFLEVLERRSQRRQRRSPEAIGSRLEAVAVRMESADVLERLQLIQQRIDLERELAGSGSTDGEEAARRRFVRSAKAYSDYKGITYAAWREVGVPAAVLREAGVARGGA